ncbi:hypothetical protein G5T42_05070 [Microbacterium sp. 4R-513]|uniref:hypothetical protein n=1 Tax=Microbacterium sp. 4R-513 TaxID=2567934 RepID=UPI0013E14374|nr:hypothetical protein [Microbacterium sp. 4R-513]QIG38935.1 hypothetical protein G5T42_05070 [Microbacterium sp. 4R-513]
MTLEVLNTIFAGIASAAAVAGALIAYQALRISMRSREKAEIAQRAATDASASDLRTRTAVADALDGLARGFAPPVQSVVPQTGPVQTSDDQARRLAEIAERLRRGA